MAPRTLMRKLLLLFLASSSLALRISYTVSYTSSPSTPHRPCAALATRPHRPCATLATCGPNHNPNRPNRPCATLATRQQLTCGRLATRPQLTRGRLNPAPVMRDGEKASYLSSSVAAWTALAKKNPTAACNRGLEPQLD